MDRRTFLGASLAAGAVNTRASAQSGGEKTLPKITSETARLKKVLVHRPGAELLKAFPLFQGEHSMLPWELLRPLAASQQHEAMTAALAAGGAEVLMFEAVLEDAIEQARQAKALAPWLKAHVPALAGRDDKVTAAMLLGQTDDLIWAQDDFGGLRPQISPPTSLFFTRDLAVMTPRGLLLCNFGQKVRAYEAALAKFVFQHASALAKYPIALDAAAEGVFIEGGDVMPLDENTVLVGIGNATASEAAQRLAQKLKLDVIAVQMPGKAWTPGEWEGLQLIFYHLDCLLNFVDAQTVLAVPYLLEKAHAERNPLLDVLFGLSRLAPLERESRIAMIDEVRNVGWVTRHLAESGEVDKSLGRIKLLDYLKTRGVKPIFVGGPKPDGESEPKHVVERVVRECRFMAVNVVATEPGHVLAYENNEHTIAALKHAGIRVTIFPSHELVRANGGPHCLTLPLERE